MHALELAELPVTLANVHDTICISTETALLLARLAEHPSPAAEVERQYFSDFYAQPPEQKSGTVYTVANYLRPYTPPDIREVVCSITPNFSLAEVDAGRLICLSVPQTYAVVAEQRELTRRRHQDGTQSDYDDASHTFNWINGPTTFSGSREQVDIKVGAASLTMSAQSITLQLGATGLSLDAAGVHLSGPVVDHQGRVISSA